MSNYGTTWEDIEPTRPHDMIKREENPTGNALDKFMRTAYEENKWTPWIRHSYHPGDRYAELTIHRTPTARSKTDFEYVFELKHPVGLMCFEHEYNGMPRRFGTEASWLTHRREEQHDRTTP